jgi:Cu/Ag efflux protein CusF
MTQMKTIGAWTGALLVAVTAAACNSSPPPKKPAPPSKQDEMPAAKEPAAQPKSAEAAAPAAATPAAAEKTNEGPVSGVLEKTQTATATVTAIDVAARRVTLRSETGKEMVIVCGEEVRNLPQVKVGDIVTCEYRESVAYEVKKPGEPTAPPSSTAVAARAKEGEMPAAAAGHASTITASIVAIDREMKRVSLQGPDGTVVVVQVRDAEKLARVSVGERVELTYTEAVAISVSSPQAK